MLLNTFTLTKSMNWKASCALSFYVRRSYASHSFKGINSTLGKVEREIEVVGKRIADLERKMPLDHPVLMQLRDKEKQLRDEKNKLRDEKILLMQKQPGNSCFFILC